MAVASMGFSNPQVKVGAALVLGSVLGLYVMSDEQKRSVAQKVHNAYHLCGVTSEEFSLQDQRAVFSQTLQSTENVVKSSPLFYATYHAIHPSKLPWGRHLIRACGRGVSGTLASTPGIALFYGASALAIPVIQSRLMKHSYTKEEAGSTAQGIVFVAMGAPLEFGIEALGCGVSPSQLRWVPSLFGTACIAGRLAAGVLVQYQAVGRKQKKASSGDERRDLAITLVGTTIAQHGINGAMQAMSKGTTMKGIVRYIQYGDVFGKAGSMGGVRQLGGTLAQRVLFSTYWNHLSHKSRATPKS